MYRIGQINLTAVVNNNNNVDNDNDGNNNNVDNDNDGNNNNVDNDDNNNNNNNASIYYPYAIL